MPETTPPAPRLVRTASALLIGTELLTGKIQDENLHALSSTLRSLGVRLVRASVLPDELPVLIEELRRLERTSDLVVTSGGVGPTHDDLTMDAVAGAFGLRLVEEPRLRQLLQQVYAKRLTDAHLRMARVPQGAEVVVTRDVPWPTVVVGKVWILPGVPQLFRTKLMALRNSIRGPVSFYQRAVYTQLDEGELKPLLDRVVAAHPDVEIGSYPKWFDTSYKTKLTLDATSQPHVDSALSELLSILPPGEPQWVERE